MSQLPILVPASKLTKSPTNVRKSTDPAADAQLEANIAEKGIIQNLIGVPVARKKGQYRIILRNVSVRRAAGASTIVTSIFLARIAAPTHLPPNLKALRATAASITKLRWPGR